MTSIMLFRLAPGVDAYHEPKPLLGEMNVQAFRDLRSRSRRYQVAFAEGRRKAILWSGSRGHRYVEHCLLVFMIPAIAELLPQSRFVHLYRHPGEVVRSGMRRGWYAGHSWDKYRVQPLADDPIREAWDNEWGPFEKICWFWHTINATLLQHGEQLGADRMLRLAFHPFIDVETGAYQQIFRFSGLEPPARHDVERIIRQRHNAQQEGEFPPYTRWTTAQRDSLLRIAGTTMDRLGFTV